LTTNYDVYLEIAAQEVIAGMTGAGYANVPKLRVRTAGAARYLRGRKILQSEPSVELVYLHGRVREEGGHDGKLVVTEIDYAETRDSVVSELIEAFRIPDSGVLIVGASLTDPPLIEALARTRGDSLKVAVVPVQSVGYTEHDPVRARRLVGHMKKRGELLGVEIATPDFKFQLAQFLEELLLCVSHPGGAAAVLADETRLRYGLRLCDWWEEWLATVEATDQNRLWSSLRQENDFLAGFVNESVSDSVREDTAKERRRLELWVRAEPAQFRNLTLWGTSSGPIWDRSVLATHQVRLASGNASVAAFTEGRPQHYDVDALKSISDSNVGRWKSFLSVPVYTSVRGAKLPVGVVTWASNQRKDESTLPLSRISAMEKLIEHLVRFGRSVLSVEEQF
jgi:SIR2-like domain